MQANDPYPRKETQNVSESNATEVTAMGNQDAPYIESTEAAEKQRVMQAPNRSRPWFRNQQSRDIAMSGPRFEQTIMEMQVGASVPHEWMVLTWIAATTVRSH